MQINRRLAKNKDIVYEIKDGEDVAFHGVVDHLTRRLYIVIPGEKTRAIDRVITKLLAKAKHRDGILADYSLHEYSSFEEVNGETLIQRQAEPA